jgi:hypothetical protein
MERSSESKILFNDEKFAGICLGAESCTEHESGCQPLERAFGIPEALTRDNLGLAARSVSIVPKELMYCRFGTVSYLVYSREVWRWSEKYLNAVDPFLHLVRPQVGHAVSGAWDEDSFIIRIPDDKDDMLKQLFDALRANDAVIFVIGGTWVGVGLHIGIKSRVPVEVARDCEKADKKYLDLKDAVAASGIKERLKAAGKEYYGLKPRWIDDAQTGFKLFLCPKDQQRYEMNWFTVADLDAWIRDEGPVLKKQAVSA